ncbi:uncharacterized protein KGF55_003751 [Candida pseudojiufengensis]|uniref:uncharacterized protein n=1 Tax=Candida pseudojiufengensis TaxID=497109 RepID=UPI002224C05B|nr:uncharacterized protein KGF55_003751 [Candida pseudojiufengensis]KAI5962675.1 hypothetical protein KGF55_003751 [Candida pseudojiufengensis]
MNQIIEEITLNGQDYTLTISYDHSHIKTAPITIYLIQSSTKSTSNYQNYIYVIQNSTTQLIGLENLEIKFFILKLSKKLEVPLYFGIVDDESNVYNLFNGGSSFELFKTIIDLINDENSKLENLKNDGIVQKEIEI